MDSITNQNPEKRSVYQFGDRLAPKAIEHAIKSCGGKMPLFELSKIELQPVKYCQLDCPWCFGRYLRDTESESSRTPSGPSHLSLEVIENNMLKPLHNAGLSPLIVLSGLYSDPLTYPNSEELFELLAKYKFRFGLYTNGIGLNVKVIDAMVHAANVYADDKHIPCYVSFDIAALLMVNKFDKVYPHITEICNKRDSHNLHVNAPVVLNNYIDWGQKASLEQISQMLIDIGVDKIRYNYAMMPLMPQDQLMKQIHQLENENADIQISIKPFSKCFVMTQSLSVHASGDIYPCSQTTSAAFKELSFGNINEQTILEIWQGEKHQAFYEKFNPSKSICRCNQYDNHFNSYCQIVTNDNE